jgi:cell division protein YceG involved in septum cleavage
MLTKRKDTYQVDTEEEAVKLIEDAKQNIEFELKKYSSQKKIERKSGDEYYIVTLEKEYGLE